MNNQTESRRRSIVRWTTGIGIALAFWCALIVWGIIRSQSEFDYRKPLFVFAVFAAFALVWIVLAWNRGRKNR